jgi:hypothetical protein
VLDHRVVELAGGHPRAVLQAAALTIAWWQGVLGVFFEMALAFLTGAAVNLGLQRYIPWFAEHFPEVDVYTVINSYLWTMIITLVVLALIRPLLLRRRGTPLNCLVLS